MADSDILMKSHHLAISGYHCRTSQNDQLVKLSLPGKVVLKDEVISLGCESLCTRWPGHKESSVASGGTDEREK